jgi:hypothetical protein
MAERLLTALVTAVFISGVVLISLSGAAEKKQAEKKQEVADEIIINSSLYPEHTYDLTKFTHKKHQDDYKIECNECHHVYNGKPPLAGNPKDKKNTYKEGDKVQKCQECHDELSIKNLKKLPEDKKKRNLELAYHNNCIGCHKKLKKQDKKKYKKIPTTCKKCHPAGKLKK